MDQRTKLTFAALLRNSRGFYKRHLSIKMIYYCQQLNLAIFCTTKDTLVDVLYGNLSFLVNREGVVGKKDFENLIQHLKSETKFKMPFPFFVLIHFTFA